ncbi:uncharacterized protein BP5553_10097 [Venustampulla echinocandica]|uniref:Serine/threonine-protein kinase SSN3 n=1 Tax=Venustampulla echinocandica TaxID=2656787 RepID=A0A370TAC7_9HELO|nr:uncharacterized protein BP5553_10097 [Venustampulla echinocandica]RDL30752.1 hypothetical protein BP5553_10097 [Venustampulla echinocandica]
MPGKTRRQSNGINGPIKTDGGINDTGKRSTSPSLPSENIFLFIPNLIGYSRIVLTLASLHYMPFHPRKCSLLYSISCLLDALDGAAARKFKQSTRFGAVLDMVIDRCTTSCLLVFLASAFPRWSIVFQALISLDLASHFMHMYATLAMGGSSQSHKKIDKDRPWVMRKYYSDTRVLFTTCAMNKVFFIALYLLSFSSPNSIPSLIQPGSEMNSMQAGTSVFQPLIWSPPWSAGAMEMARANKMDSLVPCILLCASCLFMVFKQYVNSAAVLLNLDHEQFQSTVNLLRPGVCFWTQTAKYQAKPSDCLWRSGILENKSIFMKFEYAEHDLLQIIHHHTQQPRQPIPPLMIKSIIFQLINGCKYLHANWVLHRDLKPANIMVTSSGVVKIGDFGLARPFYKPLQSLFSGDKVVVTIWYRAPELLLGSWHYGPAVDMWAVGCIFAELLSLRPIFRGEEAKADIKKVPFQRSQMQKIIDILGVPTKDQWPLLTSLPEYNQFLSLQPLKSYSSRTQNQNDQILSSKEGINLLSGSNLDKWYYGVTPAGAGHTTPSEPESLQVLGAEGYKLLAGFLEYDPERRLTAEQALDHALFHTGSKVSTNCFDGLKIEYPHRRVSQDDIDIWTSTGSLPVTKRDDLPDDKRPAKKFKEG